jgi:hypothetical protein
MEWPVIDSKPSEPDPGTVGGRQDQIALKYLDLARAEILDRMKASNQTLIVYVGGVGAIVGWMYQATIASKDHANMRTLVFPTGVIVAFLALAATWIIFHNERMVNALARYQKTVLAPYFKSVAPGMIAWESSDALHDTDDRLAIAATIIVQAILVIGPSFVFLGTMLYFYIVHPVASPRPQVLLERWAIRLAACLTFLAIIFTGFTIWHRQKLRNEPRDLRAH